MRKLKNLFHLAEAILANIYFGFPSKKIKVVGVTGTDGKTTTAHLIDHILKKSGKKVSLISSIEANIGGQFQETGLHVTTPSPLVLEKFLKQAADAGDEFFVLETTAHGIDQNRIWGISYLISVLTNITHEHLKSVGDFDYFNTWENYLSTKARLLLLSKTAILNKDDQSFKKIKTILKKNNKRYYSYSLKGKADYFWDEKIKTKIKGEMNKYNILAALAVCDKLGVERDKISKAIETFKLPRGRLDIVYDKGFKVVIDFAHTIAGITNLLKTLKSEIIKKKEGRIIHVFGAAGLRDKTKREKMGQASGKVADVVILTEEDYRSEDPTSICQQIGQGFKKAGVKKIQAKELGPSSKKVYSIIIKRDKAIEKAIDIAKEGDLVVTTGKGHEKSLARGKKEYRWDEYEAVRQALQLKFKIQKSKFKTKN